MNGAVLPAAMDKRGHDRILGEPEAGMDAKLFDSNAIAGFSERFVENLDRDNRVALVQHLVVLQLGSSACGITVGSVVRNSAVPGARIGGDAVTYLDNRVAPSNVGVGGGGLDCERGAHC